MQHTLRIFVPLLFLLAGFQSYAQCPLPANAITKTHTEVTCNGANDGTITVELNIPVTNFELYDLNLGSYVTLSVTEVQTATKVVYSNVPPSTYQVVAFKTACAPRSYTETPLGTDVSEPTAVTFTTAVTDVTPCAGGTNGSITITASGGSGAGYQYSSDNGSTFQASNVFSGLAAGTYAIVVKDNVPCLSAAQNTVVAEPAPVTFTTAATNVTCNGGSDGSIAITASGGSGAGYQYSSDGGATFQAGSTFSGLAAGSYTIQVKDGNNCTSATAVVTITEPTAITFTTVSVNPTCNGGSDGSITVTASGGTGVLQYSNDNGATFQASNIFSSLAAATYQIVVKDANNCLTAPSPVTLTAPVAVTFTTAVVDVLCQGQATGSITVTAAGGSGSYTYSKDNGATFQASNAFSGLIAGNYNVIVKDGSNCSSAMSVVAVNQPAALTFTTSTVNVSCNGLTDGSITVTAAGGTVAYQYSKDNGATFQAGNVFSSLAAGSYTIVVKDAHACSTSSLVTLTQPTAVTASVATANVSCNGGSNGTITVTAGGGSGAGYQYSSDNGGSFQASNTFSGLTAGSYTVIVKDGANCTSASVPVTITQPTAISFSTTNVNPLCNGGATGSITVTASGGTGALSYSDNNGVSFQASNAFSGLTGGTYQIVVRDGNNCTTAATPVVLTDPAVVSFSTAKTDVLCHGASTGSITVTAAGGTGAYQYSGDNGSTFQVSNVFSGLIAGTYQIVVKDANACTTSASAVTITEPATLTISTSTTAANCNGASNGSITLTAGGGTPGYQYSKDNGATFQAGNVFAAVAAGTYTVVIKDASNCTVSSSVTVTQPTALTVSTSSSNVSCNGGSNGSITVTASGGSPGYQYSKDNGATFQAGTSFGSLSAGSYQIVVKDSHNCLSAPSTVTITAPAALSISSTAHTDAICNGTSTGTITVVATGGTGVLTYTLAPTAVSNTTGAFNALAAGSYTVSVTDANACGPVTTAAIVVTNPPAISAVLSVSGAAAICQSATTDLVVNITNGTGPFTVVYSDGSASATVPGYVSGANIPVSPAATVTYQLVSVTDNSSCTASTLTGTPTVTVHPQVTPSFPVASADVCLGTTGVNYITDSGGGETNYVWTVSAGGVISSGGTAADAFAVIDWTNAAGPQSVSVSYTDGFGCNSATTVFAVNVAQLTDTQVVTDNTRCTAPFDGSIAITTAGAVGALTYDWNGPTGPLSGQTITNLQPGGYDLTITDATSGCVVVESLTVNDNSPILDVTPNITDNTRCALPYDGAIDLTMSGLVGVPTISWTGPLGFTGNTQTITQLIDGNYDVTVSDPVSGCSITLLGNTVVDARPVLDLSGYSTTDNTQCSGPFDGAIDMAVSGGGPAYTYSWTGPSGYTAATANLTGLAAGDYNLTVTDDASACVASTVTPITLFDLLTTVTGDIAVSGATTVCAGSPANLSFTLSGVGPTYDVTYTDGTSRFSLSGITDGTLVPVTPAGSVSYTLVSVTDISTKCAAFPAFLTGSADVTVLPAPAPLLAGNSNLCAGATGIVYTTDAGNSAYAWTVTGGTVTAGGTNTDNTVTVTWSTSGAGTVSVNYTDSNGCSAGAPTTLPVTISDPATAALSGTTSICVGGTATLSIALTGAAPWNIDYSDGSNTITINGIGSSPYTLAVNPLFSTTYTLVDVTDSGCGPGTVSGNAVVTVNPIPGNPATFGSDQWIGYVYTDAGSPAPPSTNITFNNANYRGFIADTDIAGMSATSAYNGSTDAFDLNIGNNASGFDIHGPNVCGNFNDDFSIRFRNTKTFTAGVYTFNVGGDDGVRLFVDGALIDLQQPNTFANHAYTTYTSVPVCLTTGTHDLVLEYYEHTGSARVSFDFSAAPTPVVASPVSLCVASPAPTLSASSPDPAVTGFRWYTDASLANLVASAANYTPSAAELDVNTPASTTFYVTATYACGESPAASMVVDVVSGATISTPPPPVQLCQTGGVVDLTTLVSAVPTGGTFTFAGTGITTSPNFDPALVSGTSTITINYTTGSCSASTTMDIQVAASASITVPSSPVSICQSAGIVDLTTVVTATPLGGTFLFSGTGVTGNNFDPAGLTGTNTITVNYNAGAGCSATATFDYDVVSSAVLTIVDQNICPNGGPIDLNVPSIVSASLPGGTFSFTGPSLGGSLFDPFAHAGTTVPITVSYSQGGCSSSGTIQVAVKTFADATCNGSGTGNCATVVIVPVPSAATCTNADGGVVFNINPPTPTVNNTGVIIDLTGVSVTNSSVARTQLNSFVFTALPAGLYTFRLQYGDAACVLNGSVTIDQTGTVGTPSANNVVPPACFGTATGSVTLDVPGETGNLLEWSLDGVNWTSFIAGSKITGIPAGSAPLFDRLISVRRNSSDPCNAAVIITMQEANPDITATVTHTDASCNNNDGTLTISNLSGGTGVANFTYELNGNPITLGAGNVIGSLSAGPYTFTVVDGNGCRKNFASQVDFPGYVNTTAPVVTPPGCTAAANDGSVAFQITDVGSYTVGITQDAVNQPAQYADPGGANVNLTGLSNGTYYIWIKPGNSQCLTKLAPISVAGAYQVSFAAGATGIVCAEDKGSIQLTSFVGAPGLDYTYELVIGGSSSTGTVTFLQSAGTYTIPGLSSGDYEVRLFQDQSSLVASCPTAFSTGFKNLTVTGPRASLDTLYVNRTISYPDLPTGSALIGIKESLEEPYEVRLELIQPLFPSQSYLLDWTEASRNGQNLKVEYDARNLYAGAYTLSVRDSLGCQKDFPISIDVDTEIMIPNVFTPNGDGVNEVFYIRNLPSNANLVITNRWGKEVYSSGNYLNDWTGGNNEDGVYYYRLSASGQSYSGWVEVMRSR
ncbi:MAG: gliding motility-associated C-terminal domain-containing protein [Cyclobacteriaceae bacterium]